MLPGIRILFALVILSFAIVVFGFGALALLRTAHQNLASQPAWQQDWRTPVEIANARRDEPAAGETQTLALLRVEPSTAKPDTPPVQPQAQDTQDNQDNRASIDTTANVSAPPLAVTSSSVAGTSDNGEPATGTPAAATTSADTAPVEKTADQTTPPVPPTDDPGQVADSSEQLKVANLPNPADDQAAQPASGADTSTAPVKTSENEPAREVGETVPGPAKSEPPVKVAALADATSASNEPARQARRQGARQSDAVDLRTQRRARARLRARRLAHARARAARLAQTQQTTSPSYYTSNFTTTGSDPTSTTPNAQPFGTQRGAP
jgi:hypothetical protein